MNSYFENAKSIEYSLLQKHAFYSFINGTMHNEFPILPHWHYYIEILYIITGTGTVLINGKSIVLKKGDVFYILPKDVHSINIINEKNFEYIVIKFDPDIIFDLPQETIFFKNLMPVLYPVSPLDKHIEASNVNRELSENILNIYKLFIEKPYGFDLLIKSKILNVFYFLVDLLRKNDIFILNNTEFSNELSFLIPAYEYIHEHFMESITAKQVAEKCKLSYSYFSRQFKKISNITFTQYLNFIRITEAEKLLLEHEKSITEIGFQVGFSDTSYFIKQFKIYKKVTPKQFLSFL